jgi:LAO/AO transport system kinase
MEVSDKIMAGDVRAASLLIRRLEDRVSEARPIMKRIYPNTGNAHIIGFTGPPGAGKSTLIDATIAEYRKRGKTVGALLVDPSSPFTGGSLLGDRVRMQRHAHDPDVFLRSMSSRGALGGLSRAVGEAVHVLDAMGKDIIIIETVGSGQMGIDIINHAHTIIVVEIPGMGDEIQVLKAGILEIADIFMINKGHHDGGGKLYQQLMHMLNMVDSYPGGWRPPILIARELDKQEEFAKIIETLVDTMDEHYRNIVKNDLLSERIERKVMIELNEALESTILEPVIRKLMENGKLDDFLDKVVKKELDPTSIADELAQRIMQKLEEL